MSGLSEEDLDSVYADLVGLQLGGYVECVTRDDTGEIAFTLTAKGEAYLRQARSNDLGHTTAPPDNTFM